MNNIFYLAELNHLIDGRCPVSGDWVKCLDPGDDITITWPPTDGLHWGLSSRCDMGGPAQPRMQTAWVIVLWE